MGTAFDDRQRRGESSLAVEDRAVEDGRFWVDYLAPFLGESEVRAYLQLSSTGEVERWRRQGRLLAVSTDGGWVFPAFQFEAGAVEPTIAHAIATLHPVVESPATIASWLKAARPSLLDGKTPLQWLREGGDPGQILAAAAEAAAARLDR